MSSSSEHQPQQLPPSPLSDLAQAAVQMHELYTAFQEAGFTRRESLELLETFVFNQGGAK